MVKQVRIIGIVGDGQHYVGRGQGDDEAGWHAVQRPIFFIPIPIFFLRDQIFQY